VVDSLCRFRFSLGELRSHILGSLPSANRKSLLIFFWSSLKRTLILWRTLRVLKIKSFRVEIFLKIFPTLRAGSLEKYFLGLFFKGRGVLT